MNALPPGTILQLMYFSERLDRLKAGRFVEIGAGAGEITSILLSRGWSGSIYEFDARTAEKLRERFSREIASDRLVLNNSDYVQSETDDFDLVVSSMVMEHLSDGDEALFMQKSLANLERKGGMLIGIVPAGPRYWGVEDDIAGHFRRYTPEWINSITHSNGGSLVHVKGLTFPVSNLLLPLSNYLVAKQEGVKVKLSKMEQTKESGRRNVKFKTTFPSLFSLILNRYTMYPLHILQKALGPASRSLVLYFEAKPGGR
ncbi:class I SAM-dependent methyltransferase [Rhizobium hidalgonense]|uniref:Class I SAM-dependent methyltransferase n=1 Tax=Rhizobium hidalgonense TaxID=1538159 RepID=A0AAJ2LR73_9HYPH|nr:class I SAM-dependent methyltransferase [Rhizobium hidalgonense]MDR9777571.1 class I SAM-dependent methyltransferase [Rhizobium hidalgonense]MDR9823904.1 class I SAM-dependent methyltransferase [Rhizobium hidalgonense]